MLIIRRYIFSSMHDNIKECIDEMEFIDVPDELVRLCVFQSRTDKEFKIVSKDRVVRKQPKPSKEHSIVPHSEDEIDRLLGGLSQPDVIIELIGLQLY